MRIRVATVAEAGALAALHRETVLVAYAGLFPPDAPAPTHATLVADWEGALADPLGRVFVGVRGDLIVGAAAVRADPDDPQCGQLRRLHVRPSEWGQGTGTALHAVAVETLRQDGYTHAGLWVLEANARARRFYERRGWRVEPGRVLDAPVREVRYRLAPLQP